MQRPNAHWQIVELGNQLYLQVIATGTIVPFVMWCSISSPYYQNKFKIKVYVDSMHVACYEYKLGVFLFNLGSRGCSLSSEQVSRGKVDMAELLDNPGQTWQSDLLSKFHRLNMLNRFVAQITGRL